MGWLYMTSLDGHATPRAYLDHQFTYERPSHRSRVLRSSLVGMRTYYAAVEHIKVDTGEREVFALICLVRYKPHDRDGDVFGYKDLEESMGPCESDCPEAILDLLTPTTSQNALQWRQNCRAKAAARRANAAKPSPRPGQTIIFDQPVRFGDGVSACEMQVIAHPRGGRALYTVPGQCGLYRVSNVKRRDYRLVDPKPTATALPLGPEWPQPGTQA